MKGFRLGSIAGFEISIDWSWFIIFFLIVYSLGGFAFRQSYPGLGNAAVWGVAVAAAILLFASVLAHELMHSIVARRYGLNIKGITLFIFGGVSQISSEPQTAKVEFNMAIAGPITSLVLGGIFLALWRASTVFHWPLAADAILNYLGTINLALGIFNLIPGFPLDGGRVLRAGLWQWTKNLVRATRDASYVGQAFGYLLVAIGVFFIIYARAVISGIWLGFIGWYLIGAAKQSYQQVLFQQALSGVDVESVMSTDIPTVEPQVTVGDFVNDYLMRQRYSNYPVADHGEVKGVVGTDEVKSVPREQWQNVTVGEISHPVNDDLRVRPEDNAWDALVKLATQESPRLLVMEDTKLDGVVTQDDILRVVRTKMELER